MASIIKVDQIQTASGGTPTAADLGLNVTGAVLQVVQANTNTSLNITTNSLVDTGVEATITPTSATSKILICCDYATGKNNTDTYSQIRIYKNGSSIVQLEANCLYTGSANWLFVRIPLTYLDSPNTTAATTYTIYAKNNTATGQIRVNPDNSRSTITLMEIAG